LKKPAFFPRKIVSEKFLFYLLRRPSPFFFPEVSGGDANPSGFACFPGLFYALGYAASLPFFVLSLFHEVFRTGSVLMRGFL